VDQAQRREDVARAAAALIAARGMAAVTFRNLAGALGCSTTAISHYFPNRNAILLETYRFVASRAHRRRLPPEGSDGHALLESLERILPIDAEKWDDWVVWLCFWTEALFNPALAAEHQTHSRETRRMLEELLVTVGMEREGAYALSQKVMTTIYGIAIQAAFDDEFWTPAAQRQALREVLQPVFALLSEGRTAPA
jgi:AcrR family transcriptional regulator